MKILVDTTALLPPRTGIGTFTTELVRELSTRPDIQLSALTYGRLRSHGLPSEVRGRVREVPGWLLPRRSRRLWSKFSIPRLEWFAGPIDVLHSPNYLVPPTNHAATVVSVHDIGFEHNPPMCVPGAIGHKHSVRSAIRKGAWIHTISQYVAEEVRSTYKIDEGKVMCVPPGVRLCKPTAHPKPGSPYILALGATDRRKDFTTLVTAFNRLALRHPDLRLIHAGPSGDQRDDFASAILKSPYRDRIVTLGWVSDGTRAALLLEASVVACPSRYEGFGFVPLEAMLVGSPVVTTAVSAIPEVVGDAALYALPKDPESLADALDIALTDTAKIYELKKRGQIQARKYTWQKAVDGLLLVYRNAMQEKS